jgi:hypothetical protein
MRYTHNNLAKLCCAVLLLALVSAQDAVETRRAILGPGSPGDTVDGESRNHCGEIVEKDSYRTLLESRRNSPYHNRGQSVKRDFAFAADQ